MKSMKLKLAMPIVLAGAITFGLCGGITNISKDKLMIEAKASESVKVNNNEKLNAITLESTTSAAKAGQQVKVETKSYTKSQIKEVKLAAATFSKCFGKKLDLSDDKVDVKYTDSLGQKACWIKLSNQPDALPGEIYDAMIEMKSGILVQCHVGNNSKDVKPLSIKEMESIAIDFLNSSKLIGDKKVSFDEKAMSDVMNLPSYSEGSCNLAACLYDNNRGLNLTIDRESKKVTGFYFDGIINGLG